MAMMRFVMAWLCLGALCAVRPAAAQQPATDAAAVHRAASAFDAGGGAYRAERYEAAASSFEAADQAVPSARALRMAIRSREQAGQADRAATLAGQALLRYPDDEKTRALAEQVVARHRDALHRLEVSCLRACVLAVGQHSVPGQARQRWTIYLEPGRQTISASFVDGPAAEQQRMRAHAGGHNTISFMGTAPAGASDGPGAGGGGTELGGDGGGLADDDGGAVPDGSGDADGADGSSWIASPAVFVVLSVATAGVGAVTVWSGVDTVNSPGADAVRQACAGQGEDCPEYQQGRGKQTRTNALLGATVGVAVLTAVFGLFVTDWGGGEDIQAAMLLDPADGVLGARLTGRF